MSVIFLWLRLQIKHQEMLLTEHVTRWRRFLKPSSLIDFYRQWIRHLRLLDLYAEFSLIDDLVVIVQA